MRSFSPAASLQARLPDGHRKQEPAASVGGESVGSSGTGRLKGELQTPGNPLPLSSEWSWE